MIRISMMTDEEFLAQLRKLATNSKKTKIKGHPNQNAYLYLEDVAHDVGAILHDKWLNDKPKALMALPGVELGYDDVARLYRQYREKGNLERLIIELYKEM